MSDSTLRGKGNGTEGTGGRPQVKLLLLEDDPSSVFLLKTSLGCNGTDYQIRVSESLEGGLQALKEDSFDAALVDLNLVDSVGADTVRMFRETDGEIPLVVVTGDTDVSVAKEAMALGAQDYVVKSPLTWPMLGHVVASSIARAILERAVVEKNQELEVANGRLSGVIHQARGTLSVLVCLLIVAVYLSVVAQLNAIDARVAGAANSAQKVQEALVDLAKSVKD